ncbi:MAG: hypothetical protein V2I54_10860 [Bacteroidales bacterium]|jgi:hypothetical protein|nr:hypothetical protein [Bacteroidales bacterium]
MVKEKSVHWMMIVLALFQAFNGLSGLLGGFGLISDPTGISLSMKQAWLEGTPFANYLLPGIVLFIVNGLGNITGFWITFKKKTKAPEVAVLFGILMMIWITAQVCWIGYKSFLQPLYFSTGLFQMILGIRLSRLKSKENLTEG